jgi:hypothetical protein
MYAEPQGGEINRVSGGDMVAYGKAGRAAAAIGSPTLYHPLAAR